MKSLGKEDTENILKAIITVKLAAENNIEIPYIPMFEGNKDAAIAASLLRCLAEGNMKKESEFLNYCEVSSVLANIIMQRDKLDILKYGGSDGKKL